MEIMKFFQHRNFKIVAIYLAVSIFFVESDLRLDAESYALYVDEKYEGSEKGTQGSPYASIAAALKKAEKGDRIYLKKGEYQGGFKLPEGVGLVGEDRDSVVIEGKITVADKSSLENLTASGGRTAILVEEDASFLLAKSNVREATKIGIDIPPGNGKVIVKNSRIYSNGKGLYIQRGNKLEISGSEIFRNSEEGIDIRDKVDGFIQGNDIRENGESGIEIILGDTDMTISANSIVGNKSSGIAAQYYEAFNGIGELIIKKNTIKRNLSFGLKCNMPSGGKPSRDYWDKSMTLDDNVFDGNAHGKFSERCRLTLNDLEIGEINENQDSGEISSSRQAEEERKRLEEEQWRSEEAIRKIQEQELIIEEEIRLEGERISNEIEKMSQEKNFRFIFRGYDKSSIEGINLAISRTREKSTQLKQLAASSPTEEIRESIEGKMAVLDQGILEKERNFQDLINSGNSFWKRIGGYFR